MSITDTDETIATEATAKTEKWEVVWSAPNIGIGIEAETTKRLRVPGGWIYRHSKQFPKGEGGTQSMVFVPAHKEVTFT